MHGFRPVARTVMQRIMVIICPVEMPLQETPLLLSRWITDYTLSKKARLNSSSGKIQQESVTAGSQANLPFSSMMWLCLRIANSWTIPWNGNTLSSMFIQASKKSALSTRSSTVNKMQICTSTSRYNSFDINALGIANHRDCKCRIWVHLMPFRFQSWG